jgi:T5SS/PEP-CTERM-associated repeat protein
VTLGNMAGGSGTLEINGGHAAFNELDVGFAGISNLTIRNGDQPN